MRDREACLSKIAAVRDAAADPDGAYLIRMRLKRAVLACHRAVATECGLMSPNSPGYLLPVSGSETDRRIAKLANEVLGQAERLCQPSESLDARWKAGWTRLEVALNELETAVDVSA